MSYGKGKGKKRARGRDWQRSVNEDWRKNAKKGNVSKRKKCCGKA